MDAQEYHSIKLSGPYIGEQLTYDLQQRWSCDSGVVISTPTGSGKNTFVREIMTRSLGPNEYMLVVTNRVALDRQQKIALLEYYGHDNADNYSDSIDGLLIVGNIYFSTYQSLHHVFSMMHQTPYALPHFRFVVLDEAHFFVSDSLFNPYTQSLLKNITINFCEAIRIYLTATPDDVLPCIISAEYSR